MRLLEEEIKFHEWEPKNVVEKSSSWSFRPPVFFLFCSSMFVFIEISTLSSVAGRWHIKAPQLIFIVSLLSQVIGAQGWKGLNFCLQEACGFLGQMFTWLGEWSLKVSHDPNWKLGRPKNGLKHRILNSRTTLINQKLLWLKEKKTSKSFNKLAGHQSNRMALEGRIGATKP